MSRHHHTRQIVVAKKIVPLKHRIVKAAVAPVGVHSILDVAVLSDLAVRVHEGATTLPLMVGGWLVARTVCAFVASYMEEA
jgi:hypothetical protein